MKIRTGYTISFESDFPAPIMMMLNVRPEREADLITPDIMRSDPELPLHRYTDGFGNTCTRAMLPAGRVSFSSDFLIRDSGEPDPVTPDAQEHPIQDLPDEAVIYLLGSRYCETDHLVNEAWDLFGKTEPGWARVQAIVAYTHERITFGYPHARATRTAREAHAEGLGVCRDYAHLAIALCRCMNIPARYCTGYMGDIGIPPIPGPMDFSAWFQVYLGGAWRTFDARHNKPRMARVMMAIGRDATDVAISTTFGSTRLVGFDVVSTEVKD